MSSKYRIPFVSYADGRASTMMEYTHSKDGEVQRPSASNWQTPTEWRDNVPFSARVQLTSHGRGRSSVRVYAYNTRNKEEYSMGLAAFYEAAVKFGVHNGAITGTWCFRKQGSNYTLWPAEDE